MKYLSVLLTIFGSIYAVPLKVANGTVEPPHTSPWQAKLYPASSITSIWPCGGTLISQNYVLTAARCFTYQKSSKAHEIDVYLGAWDIENNLEKGQTYIDGISLKNVTIHEDYDAATYANDIALIKLPYPANLNRYIQPAKLATQRKVKLGDVAHISGWQYPIREWNPSHQYLHGGNVTIVKNSVCKNSYPTYKIDDDTICASGTVAFCYGDEGIALPLNGEVVGLAYGAKQVLTPSEECPIMPQVYLSIAKYLDWIKKNSDYQDS